MSGYGYLDGHRAPARPLSRFLVFALAVIVSVGGLTARLFYLQVVSGGQFAALSEGNRTALEAIPSSRGLIYDRAGNVLVTNVPTFAVKIRPADLPEDRRDEVVNRLSALTGVAVIDINKAIDGNPGSRFDAVRVAQDVPKETASLIAEASFELPGVEVAVEARRQYTDGPLFSQILGYTGPVSAEQITGLKADGYLPDDLIGKTGLEAYYESDLRGTYGEQRVERDASGRDLQVLETVNDSQAGDSLKLTIDTREQKLAQQALQWGMKAAGLKRGVIIVMNPQTGEILAMVSLPTYDDNLFARGISAKDYGALLANPDKPLLNHAIAAHYPPGSTYKLVTGTGVLADHKITASTRVQTQAVPDARIDPVLRLEPPRVRRLHDLLRLRALERHVLLPDGGQAGHRPPRPLGQPVRVRAADRHRPAGRGLRHRPDEPVEAAAKWREDLPRRGLPGRHRPGLRRRHADPADQRLRGARQRRQALSAAARPRRRRARRQRGPPVPAKLIRKLDVPSGVLKTMREAARSVVTLRHTYNLVDLPIVVAGKSGTAEFGTRDSKGRLPFHSWFVGFTPKDPYKHADDPNGLKALAKGDSQLAVLAFAYDSRTKGNAAHRDREVLPAAPLRDQEGLPQLRPPEARQLLPVELMRTETVDRWA